MHQPRAPLLGFYTHNDDNSCRIRYGLTSFCPYEETDYYINLYEQQPGNATRQIKPDVLGRRSDSGSMYQCSQKSIPGNKHYYPSSGTPQDQQTDSRGPRASFPLVPAQITPPPPHPTSPSHSPPLHRFIPPHHLIHFLPNPSQFPAPAIPLYFPTPSACTLNLLPTSPLTTPSSTRLSCMLLFPKPPMPAYCWRKTGDVLLAMDDLRSPGEGEVG